MFQILSDRESRLGGGRRGGGGEFAFQRQLIT